MDVRSEQKTAIDECIEGLKIEVKKKMDVNFDFGSRCRCRNERREPQTIPILKKNFRREREFPLFML
jgi:hypothetical protein